MSHIQMCLAGPDGYCKRCQCFTKKDRDGDVVCQDLTEETHAIPLTEDGEFDWDNY